MLRTILAAALTLTLAGSAIADTAHAQEAVSTLRRANAEKEHADAAIRLQVRRAYTDLRSAQQRIETAQASVTEAPPTRTIYFWRRPRASSRSSRSSIRTTGSTRARSCAQAGWTTEPCSATRRAMPSSRFAPASTGRPGMCKTMPAPKRSRRLAVGAIQPRGLPKPLRCATTTVIAANLMLAPLSLLSHSYFGREECLHPATHHQWLSRILANLQNVFASEGRQNDLSAMGELQKILWDDA